MNNKPKRIRKLRKLKTKPLRRILKGKVSGLPGMVIARVDYDQKVHEIPPIDDHGGPSGASVYLGGELEMTVESKYDFKTLEKLTINGVEFRRIMRW